MIAIHKNFLIFLRDEILINTILNIAAQLPKKDILIGEQNFDVIFKIIIDDSSSFYISTV